MKVIYLLVTVTLLVADAKVYDKCEFARVAKENGLDTLGTWTCIASHESNFNTKAVNSGSGDYGILQISSIYWCNAGDQPGMFKFY